MVKKNSLDSLADGLNEIADIILRDDWVRMHDPHTAKYYYVMGASAWSEEIESGRMFAMTVQRPAEISRSGEYYAKAQVAAADEATEYMQRALRKAEAAGVDVSRVLAWLRDTRRADALPAEPPVDDRWLEAFAELLEAWIIERAASGDLTMNPALRVDLEIAREKLYLRDVVQVRRDFAGVLNATNRSGSD